MKALSLAELKTFLTIQISCLILASCLVLTTVSWYSNFSFSAIAALVFLILTCILLLGGLIYFLTRKILSRRWLEMSIVFYGVLGISMVTIFIFYS